MSFTDTRLPGKTYKTERGLKNALRALEKREAEAKAVTVPEVPVVRDHIRNLHNGPVRIRLKNEDADSSRNVSLNARGMRGDIARVTEAEMRSSSYAQNVNVLFEAITEEEAMRIVYNQTFNQQAYHPALAHLKTPTGEQFEKPEVRITSEIEANGVTVATLETKGASNKLQQETVIQRTVDPTHAPLPGTIDRTAESIEAEATEGPGSGLIGFNYPPTFDVITRQGVTNPTDRSSNDPVRGQERLRG